jgi:hypothetical protein
MQHPHHSLPNTPLLLRLGDRIPPRNLHPRPLRLARLRRGPGRPVGGVPRGHRGADGRVGRRGCQGRGVGCGGADGGVGGRSRARPSRGGAGDAGAAG